VSQYSENCCETISIHFHAIDLIRPCSPKSPLPGYCAVSLGADHCYFAAFFATTQRVAENDPRFFKLGTPRLGFPVESVGEPDPFVPPANTERRLRASCRLAAHAPAGSPKTPSGRRRCHGRLIQYWIASIFFGDARSDSGERDQRSGLKPITVPATALAPYGSRCALRSPSALVHDKFRKFNNLSDSPLGL
jgi:hypothetical protein